MKVLGKSTPSYVTWLKNVKKDDPTTDPKGLAFKRTFRVEGRELMINWEKKIENVFSVPKYGERKDTNVQEDSTGAEAKWDEGVDLPGPLAMLHPYIACRLLCSPAADEVYAGDNYKPFGATIKNPTGVVYGDVMHGLVKQ